MNVNLKSETNIDQLQQLTKEATALLKQLKNKIKQINEFEIKLK